VNVVVVGYGRVGSTLARELLAEGHAVTVIDNQSARVQRAVRLQGAKVIAGNAVDVEVQRQANVGAADVLLAVTSNDNVNLVACEIALEVFQVTNVIARVYASSRAEVTAERGVVTVCPTRFTIDTLHEKVRVAAGEAAPHSPPLRKKTSGRPRQHIQIVDESKFVVIAGGGRVGFHLARSLRADGHEVVLIERDQRVATELTARLDCPVIVGDGSMPGVLEEAGAGRCRVFAAVTGRDEDNLIACQTAKTLSREVKTIARVSDPYNEDLYRALGVDATVSSTSLIRGMIERELPTLKIKTLMSIQGGGASILEVTLAEGSPVLERPLRDLVLPKDSNVIAILRGVRTVVPRGDTTFKPGDVVLTLVAKESEKALEEALLGTPPPVDPHGAPHGADSATKNH
jgi:trk/ktr system potassium uptake protein